ncbi:LLM class flavin-dependent oxidoreductase [Mycoplasmopsis gallopavonis]|uniref:Alkanal monooxygenase alpha chain n=1 Tax=Mycoplasmopsis gallopavonis TaxID=76629 RepID=A0A449AYK5_9BACT|nr:LLM class flavin-dependent oxidoreductase [Mycoplasmopsis gallopavonis]RIV16745.1 LLM class flavin-dependent oxidoreductase [Mycoplasmopsis gallopavonis]VEU72567.1 Alkanal monooxygenase alpha chain [Mycoplasmopsis gallopavonis]
MKIELGITTFGETTKLTTTGKPISHPERIRNIIEEIELADKVGLDVYGIGEHHRDDFAVSAPEIILAGAATKTKNIKLTTAVTVLSSNDPIRLYQNFATIDAMSNGRAEIMVGRGSFTESFPLFGYDLNNYEELFEEKLSMLQTINQNEILNWQGNLTHSVDNKGVYPRIANQNQLPIWVATGGNPISIVNIAQRELPIVFATIGGDPLRFKNLVDIYRRAWKSFGNDFKKMKIAAHSWGWIEEDHNSAIDNYFLPTKQLVDSIAKTRPHWREMTREQYNYEVSLNGAIFAGNPEYVAQKIIRIMEGLELDRFMLHIPVGSMPHKKTLKAIELFGTKVAPIVRKHFENITFKREI